MESTKQKKQNPFFQWIKKAANIQGNVHKLAFDAGWQELLDYNQLNELLWWSAVNSLTVATKMAS